MALEHRDWYREKKPDWDNILNKTKRSNLYKFYFLSFLLLALNLIIYFYTFPFLHSLLSHRVSVQSLPVQSLSAVQSVPALVSSERHYETYAELCAAKAADPSFVCSAETLASNKMGLSMEKEKKQSQIVSTAGGGYSGYIEYNGKRQSVHEPAVTSQTFRYRSINNVKYLDVEINGVPFEVMLDTGASYVALNSDAVQRLGVKEFVGQGVLGTANGKIQVNYFYVSSFKLGAFEVKDVKCGYSPSNSYNLLGGSFLQHFNYEINESAGAITFEAK